MPSFPSNAGRLLGSASSASYPFRSAVSSLGGRRGPRAALESRSACCGSTAALRGLIRIPPRTTPTGLSRDYFFGRASLGLGRGRARCAIWLEAQPPTSGLLPSTPSQAAAIIPAPWPKWFRSTRALITGARTISIFPLFSPPLHQRKTPSVNLCAIVSEPPCTPHGINELGPHRNFFDFNFQRRFRPP